MVLCSPKRPDRLQGPHSLLVNGYGGSYPGAKRPGLEVYHANPCSAGGKWDCTSTPTCNDNDDDDDNNNNNVRFDVIILVR